MNVRGASALVVLALTCAGSQASAQVDVRRVFRAANATGHRVRVLESFAPRATDSLSLLVRAGSADVSGLPLTRVTGDVWALEGRFDMVERVLSQRPDLHVTWSPPRRVLLDRAARFIAAPPFGTQSGISGQGAIVGVVDTGVDLEHPDLLTAAGETRVRWLLDFSRPPTGKFAELEEAYGCHGERPCAIYDRAALELLRNNGVTGDLPSDPFGHGTHVASLAAGSGRSSADGRYRGIAPEADLIVVRATRSSAPAIFDADVLLGTRFIFERASELGLPAVVNLSLGSDFGAHDGSSELERALEAFVGPDHPGRAIVVASGNSGPLYTGLSGDYPEPFGVHTEVHVPRGEDVRVPVLTLPGAAEISGGSISVWVSARTYDRLSVALDGSEGALVSAVAPGSEVSRAIDALTVTIINGIGATLPEVDGTPSAVVQLQGQWRSGQAFALRFAGEGSVRMWLQAETGQGALFPRAQKAGTVSVPASSPGLIAVGATVNRDTWTNYMGEPVSLALAQTPATVAFFSSAGPSGSGAIKPDLVAPGAYVIGAMSAAADPRSGGAKGSIFHDNSQCRVEPASEVSCAVVDDLHAVSSGTSMAAPLVSGAVALLLSVAPSLTQPEILNLLQAGSRRGLVLDASDPSAGAGLLDIDLLFDVLRARTMSTTEGPHAAHSALVLADTYAHPDDAWPLEGLVQLRAADGRVADGFALSELELRVAGGSLRRFERVEPGLWRFAVHAPPGSTGGFLDLGLYFGGKLLLSRRVPIAPDRSVAARGYTAEGGCSMTQSRASGLLPSCAALAALLTIARRRWCNRSARKG